MIAFDIETGSADRLWHTTDPEYIRILAWTDGIRCGVTDDPDEMRRILSDADRLVAHNGFGFDVYAVARCLGLDFYGLAAKTVDTLLLSRLLFPPLSDKDPQAHLANKYDLASVCARMGLPGKSDYDLPAEAARWHTANPHPSGDLYMAIPATDPDYCAYCLADAQAALAVYRRIVRDARIQYREREERFHAVAAGITWRGFRVNTRYAVRREAEDNAAAEKHRMYLRTNHGMTVSRKLSDHDKRLLAEVLEREAGVRLPSTESKGLPNTTSQLLEQVDHPATRAVVAINKARGLPAQTLKHRAPDGRVHPRIDPSRQATGRWSVTKPGLTTWGSRSNALLADRRLFRAAPGHKLCCIDYSQIDVRGMAAVSQDQAMIARLQPGMDWHTEMAVLVFGDAEMRKQAKPLSHAINYNAGADTIAHLANITVEEARALLTTLDAEFHELAGWKTRTIDATRAGRPLRNGWGRLLNPSIGREHTQAPGLVGQSWARDAVAEGLLRLAEAGLDRYIVLHVHDEFVFEFPADQAEALRDKALAVMQFERDGVPVLCEASPLADTWDACYTD